MKALTKILLSFAIAIGSMTAMSTTAVAAEESVSATVLIDETVAKIENAITAIDNGSNGEEVTEIIKEARQIQKDVVIGALDMDRQKASSKLMKAGRFARKDNLTESKVFLEKALTAYKDLSVASTKL